MSVILNLALKYFENNPDQAEKLIAAAIDALINHLKHTTTPPVTK